MDVKLAFVADAANDAQGKLNVLGIFDRVNPSEYPYIHPQMCLVVSFEASPAEFGRTKNIEIMLLDPDARPLSSMKASGKVPKPEAGTQAHFQFILRLVNTPFPKHGPYEFAILVGGDRKASIQIEAVPIPKPPRKKRKKANDN